MEILSAQNRGCCYGTSSLLNSCLVWRRGCTGVRLQRSSPVIRPARRQGVSLAAQASIAERVTAVKGKFKVPEHWQEHVKNMAGGKQRALHRYFDLVKEINELEPQMQKLTDDDLEAKTAEFKQRLSNGVSLDGLLVEAFAVVREVSSRVLRMRHFDAQLVGGIVLHEGSIAEMKTGEGKTLVATLPTYLNALAGQGVHVVTVNDYLAERDANWQGDLTEVTEMLTAKFYYRMGKIFKFLGLSVAVITDATLHPSRRELFKADVLYITAMQLTFSYLQDNTAKKEHAVAIRRPFSYAIVDEVDSILIDDCRNPLLISGSSAKPVDRYRVATQIVAGLTEDTMESGMTERVSNKSVAVKESTQDSDTAQGGDTEQGKRPKPASGQNQSRPKQEGDFVLDVQSRQAALTEMGLAKVFASLCGHPAVSERFKQSENPVIVWEEEEPWGPYIINAIKAEHLYIRDKDYIVEDNLHVKIISRSTGRVQSKSRWTDNIHQAVEAKENLTIGLDGSTQATITYQMFFRYYAKLAGMTGTAITEAEEFFNVYKLNVVQVPSRLPNQRIDHEPVLFVDFATKLINIYVMATQAHSRQRPVLIGTSSVEESEAIQQVLEGRMWPRKDPISPWEVWTNIGMLKELRQEARARWASREMLLLYDKEVPPASLALLNAKPENVRREAQIIAQAGLPGAVTIATNMAGRGTDIVLGGNPKGLALQILMKIFARYFLTGKEYASNKKSLDQVSLPEFAWVVPAPDFFYDEPDIPDHGQQPPDSTQNPQADRKGQPAKGLEGAGNGQPAPAHGPGVHLKDPSADGQGNGSNGQAKPVNGSAPPVNGKHKPSDGVSANGSVPTLIGQHHSPKGASNSGQHAAQGGAASPGSHARQPSSHQQPELVHGPQAAADSPGRPTHGQLQGLDALRAAMKKEDLHCELATRLEKAAQVCCVAQSKMSLDAAQSMISTVLDQAEELQTQIITEAWGGVGAFEAKSHAAEATKKADELFSNDQVPAFQKNPAAGSPESARRMAGKGKNCSGVGLEVQKHLAWSAMHLLFYLELTCQRMAKSVKAAKGLLVISTAIQDSRRSVNQLQGRAGRQGDPGETLTFYDFDDAALKGDPAIAVTGNLLMRSCASVDMRPWTEGAVVNKLLQTITGSHEGAHRSQREDLQKFDEIMEQFRQHTYSLRRLILFGTYDQSIEMLQFYFQDAAHLLVERIIDAKKPVGKWNWDQVLEEINHLAYQPPNQPPSVHTDPSGSKSVTLDLDQSSSSSEPPPPDSASSSSPPSSPAAASPPSPPPPRSSSSQSSDTQIASNGAGGIRLGHHKSSHSSTEASTSSPATSGPATNGPATSGPATSGPATNSPATYNPATSSRPTNNSLPASVPPLPTLTPEQKKQMQSAIAEYAQERSHVRAEESTGKALHEPAGQSPAALGLSEAAPGQLSGAPTVQSPAASVGFEAAPGQHSGSPIGQSAAASGPSEAAPGQFSGAPAGQSPAASRQPGPASSMAASSGPDIKPEVMNEFTVGMDRLKKEDLAKICDALEVDAGLSVPLPKHLDPRYKERISRHRGALEHSAKGSGGQPRIKGRFGRQAERLRGWLGEYLIAKYEQTVQVDDIKRVRRPLEWERNLMLDTLDDIWVHFLRETSSLHSGVTLRAWSHMDPVEEFKLEAGAAFLQALADFRHECVSHALQGPHSSQLLRLLRDAREALNKSSATDATTASATSPPLALNGSTDIVDVQTHAADSQSSEKQPKANGVPATDKTKAKT